MTDQTRALAVTNYDRIKALARNESTIARFAEMLGSKREAQAYITSAMLAVANSKDLMDCTPSSVFNSAMRAAALRLYCDPALRQAYLVPFNSKTGKNATLIIGYIGLNNLAHRTGRYRFLNVNHLYEGQVMEVDQLTGATQIHGSRESDTIVGYFHYFELLSGASHTFYMTVEELHEHGNRYAARNPLWHSSFPDMAKKTVTRLNLLKFGVLDPADRAVLNEIAEDQPEGELIAGETIDSEFTEVDDERAAQEAVAAAEAAANAPRRSPDEIIGDLYSGQKPRTYTRDDAARDMAAPKPAAPKPTDPPLRYQPEQLKARIADIAKTTTGQVSNGKRGLVVSVLETILSATTNPTESRHQLLHYLTGISSAKDLPDSTVLALYKWLSPSQDTGGEWQADAMSAREALAAFNAAQPPQEALF